MPYFKIQHKITGFLSLLIFLGACGNPLGGLGGYITYRTDAEYAQIQKNRAEVIRRTRQTYAGERCSEQEKRHECYEDCDDIYNHRRDRQECEELTVTQIEKIKFVYTALEDGRESDLNKVEPEAFELYLSFSIRSIDDLVDGLKDTSDAENILVWLARNEQMSEIFEKSDDDYKTLNKLLNVIKPFGPNEVDLPFSHVVDGSDTIMDIVAQQRDQDSFTLKWFMNFIEESPNCQDTTSTSCFEVYCKIGNKMNEKEKGLLLDIRSFEDYIDDIIDEDINSGNWNPPSGVTVDTLEDTGDLENDWVDILCDGLI